MRKLLFLSVASLLMFACSKEDSVPLDNNDGKITFEISASDQMSDGLSRTPVYSQDATQNISNVNVYAFKNDGNGNYTYQKTYTIPWPAGSALQRYPVADADKVPAGDYKFLAVGTDSPNPFTINSLTVNTTKFEDMMASVTAAGNESELFAGNSRVQVMDHGSRISIDMKRKVAGILGYFKNVPQTIQGTAVQYLRLIISNSDLNVNLTSSIGSNPIGAEYRIMDINVGNQPASTTVTGVYAGNDLTSAGVVKLDNSQLGGTFLMPISGVTMTLGLYDAGNNALKVWNIEDSNGGSTNLTITANNFYSLGLKTKINSTTGGGTPDPNDDDSAVDLLLDQSIVLTVTPTWDAFHNLIILNQPIP